MAQADASAARATAGDFKAPFLPVRALNAAGRASLQPAKLLLQKTHGFLFLPVLAQSEVAGAAALQFLTDHDTRVPFQVAWPVSYLPFDADPRSVAQIKSALDTDRETLLQNLDFAIARQQTNALLILDSTPGDRHRLLEHCAPFINLRREALLARGLRFIWLWPSTMAQALMGATPDLWSMRALAPVVDAELLEASTLVTAQLHGPSAGNFVSNFPATLTRLQSEQWAAWQQHRNLRLAGLSVEDALALISVLEAARQWAAERDLCEAVLAQLADTPRLAANLWPRAQALGGLSVALVQLGDPWGALQASRRAVEICEILAQGNFPAYGAVLAGGLNNLSGHLAAGGEPAAGLLAIRRAVEICEKLTQDNFAAYGANLASSLNNLSNRLAESGGPGKLAEARQANTRALELIEPFALPGTGQADWKASMQNQRDRLAQLGDQAKSGL